MMHQPGPDGICPHCEATGLKAVPARDLRDGMLIQTRFNPAPYTEYSVGEVGMVDADEMRPFVTWSFRWQRLFQGEQEIGAFADSSFEEVVHGDYEYLPLPPGSVHPPLQEA